MSANPYSEPLLFQPLKSFWDRLNRGRNRWTTTHLQLTATAGYDMFLKTSVKFLTLSLVTHGPQSYRM